MWFQVVSAGLVWFIAVSAGLGWFQLVSGGLGWFHVVSGGFMWFQLVWGGFMWFRPAGMFSLPQSSAQSKKAPRNGLQAMDLELSFGRKKVR